MADERDADYERYLATQVASDPTLHCADRPMVEVLVRYILHDYDMTAEDWAAMRGMIERTPPTERLASRCTHAYVPRMQSL